MEISILLAQQIAQLFLMIFMGFLIVKAGLLKDEDSKVLSKIVLYLIIPCVILNAFQIDYTPETVRELLVAFAASLLMQVVLLFAVSALGRVFHLDAVEITSVYYSNSGNLIVPLVTAILGEEWVLYSCVYMSVQLVLFWTHCKKVISREASYDWKKIVLNLNIISIFTGGGDMLEAGGSGLTQRLLQIAHELPGVEGIQEVDVPRAAIQNLYRQVGTVRHVDAGGLLVGVRAVFQLKFVHINPPQRCICSE